jgi:hypothetical protein
MYEQSQPRQCDSCQYESQQNISDAQGSHILLPQPLSFQIPSPQSDSPVSAYYSKSECVHPEQHGCTANEATIYHLSHEHNITNSEIFRKRIANLLSAETYAGALKPQPSFSMHCDVHNIAKSAMKRRHRKKKKTDHVINEATSASDITIKPQLKQCTPRKPFELKELERWNCPRRCGKFFRCSSTKSIQKHKATCTAGGPSTSTMTSHSDAPATVTTPTHSLHVALNNYATAMEKLKRKKKT